MSVREAMRRGRKSLGNQFQTKQHLARESKELGNLARTGRARRRLQTRKEANDISKNVLNS